ncbi:extracellular matrix binding protein [Fructobacillus fructosus]|uniref:DUF1542 domain-containing protein n=1 Tax=Fructobacillus fructosus TaxID=1631 RepID=UPI0002DD88A9|nr:DUF1542 domain-containing protein [Fructobacillus fructosus]GAP01358.1 extracellular matrix binding protein [Fructobacillus fructosus]
MTPADKTKRKAAIDKAAADAAAAKANIDNATNSDEITAATVNGVKAIAADYKAGSMDDVKNQNKANIDDVANDAKKAIDNDGSLTPAAKNKRKAAIDEAAAKAKADIDNAKTADKAGTNADDGAATIAGLNGAKDSAGVQIDHAADKAKSDIDNDASLSGKEKNNQDQQVDQAVANAKAAIDSAIDLDAVSQLKDSGLAVINKIHQSGLPLGQQQQSANRFVENEAAKVRAEIENDPYLTQAEKTAQFAALDAMIQDVKQSIASAKDSDALEQVLVSGKQKIESVYHMGVKKTEQPVQKPVVKKDSPMPETASRVSRHAQETIGLALTASLSTFFLTKKRHDK